MPTYISLLTYTQQGIAGIKKSPERLDAAKQAYKRAGGELKMMVGARRVGECANRDPAGFQRGGVP
jgi:uncharacterized protein with GYD domain